MPQQSVSDHLHDDEQINIFVNITTAVYFTTCEYYSVYKPSQSRLCV